MRTLVVGAGAVGGYFGGRLLEAGRDVTFLVRAGRARELASAGLIIRDRAGDVVLRDPPIVQAESIGEPFDAVLLSCKAYDLESAIDSFAPAVGENTAIVPLLNGMRHLDRLRERFGAGRVLGGQCVIASTLSERREIVHLNDAHTLTFGELDGRISDRVRAMAEFLNGAKFDVKASPHVLLDMWEKWVVLAALAAGTCLMRAPVGDIVAAPGGSDFMLGLLEECRAVAAAEGYAPREAFLRRTREILTAAGSPFTASMLRDIENRAPVEADHVIGDLVERSRARALSHARLAIAYTHLKAYESRRAGSL